MTLRRVAIAARGVTAETLARLHFAAHPERGRMVIAAAPYLAARGGVLADDGVVLAAVRHSWSV